MLKAIIFDMDGVMVKTEHVYLKAFNSIAQEHGIEISEEEWQKRFAGRGVSYIVDAVFKENKLSDKNEWRLRWIHEFEKYVESEGIEVIKGFLEFNREISEAGLKKAVASGSRKETILLVIRKLGLNEKEFVTVSSEDLKEAKPSPEIFLKTAKKLGVAPAECVVFEDSLPGIAAAKRAKMKCVALSTVEKTENLKKAKPDLIIRDFREMTIEKAEKL